jgi:hypothetical protein
MRFQLLPPSVLFKIPAPLTASILNHPSPVVAKSVSGCKGSCIILLMARLGSKSFTTVHVGRLLAKLVVLKMPPLTDPTKTVFPVASQVR